MSKKIGDPKMQKVTYDDLKPGTLVLAKVKGFSPWPAMVVTDEQITDAVRAVKPKDDKQVPVRFFPMDFIWASLSDIHCLLTPEIIEQQLTRKLKKDLLKGYLMVKNPPTLEHLIVHDNLPGDMAEENEDEAEESDESVKLGRKRKVKRDKDAAVDNDDEEFKRGKIKRRMGTKSRDDIDALPHKKSVAKTKLRRKDASVAEVLSPQEKTAKEEQKRKESHERRKKEALYLRHRLQKALKLNEKSGDTNPPAPEDMDDIKKQVEALNRMTAIDLDILKSTKVHKVLKRAIAITDLPRDEELGIKTLCSEILTKWKPIIDTLKAEYSKPPSETKLSGPEGILQDNSHTQNDEEVKTSDRTSIIGNSANGDHMLAEKERSGTISLNGSAQTQKTDDITEEAMHLSSNPKVPPADDIKPDSQRFAPSEGDVKALRAEASTLSQTASQDRANLPETEPNATASVMASANTS